MSNRAGIERRAFCILIRCTTELDPHPEGDLKKHAMQLMCVFSLCPLSFLVSTSSFLVA